MAQLTLDSVRKEFRDGGQPVVAVNDVSIDVPDGEFLVLVGPSGCGKSTTLRTIAGLEDATSGTIALGGEPITDRKPQHRDIAMVFQSYALYPHMTVRENMAFGLEESTDMADDEIGEVVQDTGEMLDIEELLDRKPSDLSGGQQQRVALGRAIVREPSVFLMDEPLSNLDAKLRSQMRTELQQLQEQLGVTTVYVTHDQTEAMTMGDRIAILDGGRLQQVGTPLECYHEPANTFVAGFIGEPSMNFLQCSVEGEALVDGEFRYPLSREVADAVGGADTVTLGIRPEDVVVGESVGAEHTFAATVDVVEPRGNENTVHLTLAANGDSAVATVDGMRSLDEGGEVSVGVPEDAVHVFDGVSGEALHTRRLADVETATQPRA